MDSQNQSKFLITGGHLTPALAVLGELRKREFNNFSWVGHKYIHRSSGSVSAEYQSISDLKFPFYSLPAGKLSRNWSNPLKAIWNLLLIPFGFLKSFWIVLKVRPDVIISFGGYLALPIVISGFILRRKVITHEQTVVVGLANRIISFFAKKILVSWPNSLKYFPKGKTVLTGNPVRPEIFFTQSDNLRLNSDLPTIYITGGNQGARVINEVIFEILPSILEVANVIHQTGNFDHGEACILEKSFESFKGSYIHKNYFFSDEIGEVFSKTDLVVSRSGANTTYEILLLGKPTIFIPIPWVSHNEQLLNAEMASKTGIATVIEQSSLTSNLLQNTIMKSLVSLRNNETFNGEQLQVAKHNALELVREDASIHITDQIIELLND